MTGSLGVSRDAASGLARIEGTPRTPNGADGADAVFAAALVGAPRWAYSAARDELWALARTTSGTQLARFRGLDNRYSALAVVGVSLGMPLALTFDLDHTALYGVDRPTAGSAPRLVRIDANTGTAEVLVATLMPAAYDRVELTMTSDGRLLLAASRPMTTTLRLAHLVVVGSSVTAVDAATVPDGRVFGGTREGAAGVAFLRQQGEGYRPTLLGRADFAPLLVGTVAEVFP